MKEFRGSQNYVASEELLRAANIAMVLQKPLLIKGHPYLPHVIINRLVIPGNVIQHVILPANHLPGQTEYNRQSVKATRNE